VRVVIISHFKIDQYHRSQISIFDSCALCVFRPFFKVVKKLRILVLKVGES